MRFENCNLFASRSWLKNWWILRMICLFEQSGPIFVHTINAQHSKCFKVYSQYSKNYTTAQTSIKPNQWYYRMHYLITSCSVYLYEIASSFCFFTLAASMSLSISLSLICVFSRRFTISEMVFESYARIHNIIGNNIFRIEVVFVFFFSPSIYTSISWLWLWIALSL